MSFVRLDPASHHFSWSGLTCHVLSSIASSTRPSAPAGGRTVASPGITRNGLRTLIARVSKPGCPTCSECRPALSNSNGSPTPLWSSSPAAGCHASSARVSGPPAHRRRHPDLGDGARRVCVHTCTLGHPHALANDQARGFRIVRVEARSEARPHEPLPPWPGAHLIAGDREAADPRR
jgi:hypothetical protein